MAAFHEDQHGTASIVAIWLSTTRRLAHWPYCLGKSEASLILVKIDDDKCHGAKLVAIGRVRLVNLIRVNALVSGARKMSTMREDPMLALARPLETRGKTVFMPGRGNPPDDFSPFFDASLLLRHMERLQIDRDQLASDDPLLFRELKGRCALCRSKEQCVREDAVDQNKIGREDWGRYCPNARTLYTLGALQNCGRAAQHLRWPRSAE